ncbi:hypothetical protein [Coastal Plains virus]|uniref:Uncharacterized protein U1 n=1 Tax=Coastal Plains virus TaxID=764599 RepID=D8V083_9RHAB|nr:hypothetical protein [Coastal Plains virus]ADG86360.1 hypothetical protein [Coastal Plains virus]
MASTWAVSVTAAVSSVFLRELSCHETMLNIVKSLPVSQSDIVHHYLNTVGIGPAIADCFRNIKLWESPHKSIGNRTVVFKLRSQIGQPSEKDWSDSITLHWLDKRTGTYTMVDLDFVVYCINDEIHGYITQYDLDNIDPYLVLFEEQGNRITKRKLDIGIFFGELHINEGTEV